MIVVRSPYGFISQRGRREVSAQVVQKKDGVRVGRDKMT